MMDALRGRQSRVGMTTWLCLRSSDSVLSGCQVGEVEADSLAQGRLLSCVCPSAKWASTRSLLFEAECLSAALESLTTAGEDSARFHSENSTTELCLPV